MAASDPAAAATDRASAATPATTRPDGRTHALSRRRPGGRWAFEINNLAAGRTLLANPKFRDSGDGDAGGDLGKRYARQVGVLATRGCRARPSGRPLVINPVSRRGHRQILLATFSRLKTTFPQLTSPFQATRRRNLGLDEYTMHHNQHRPVPLHYSMQVSELRFGRFGGLGHDRGSCLRVCCI